MSEQKILIVEDNQEMAEGVAAHLTRWGYRCELAHCARDGLSKLLAGGFDLAILDVMLGDGNGLDVCKEARRQNVSLPILMLTSKTDEIDTILGLDAGADDYLYKPFKVGELEARLRALLRRAALPGKAAAPETPSDTLTFGSCVIDRTRQTVTVAGNKIDVTAREYDVLLILAESPGKPFTRAQILDALGEPSSPNYEYTMNSIIWRLRTKLEENPEKPCFILTVWGRGYRFAEPHELKAAK